MAVEHTPEQASVVGIRGGSHVVCANAGTGKTYTLAHLFLRLYLEAEARLYPAVTRNGRHVCDKEQAFLLRQFHLVTFTRDAAAELNTRVLGLMKEHGIPEPVDPYGRSPRICRTLDSLIQSWFRLPRLFGRWIEEDVDTQRAIGNSLGLLQAPALATLQRAARERKDSTLHRAFFLRWNWLAGEAVDTIIWEQLVREKLGLPPIPGVSPLDAWSEEWADYLRSFAEPTEGKWGESFWTAKIEAFQAYQREMRTEHALWVDGQLENDPAAGTRIATLKEWQDIRGACREFAAIYELARAKGYHPVRAFDQLAKRPVLTEIANARHVNDFSDLHDTALRLFAIKVSYHLLDHSDFLNLFVDTVGKYPDLLEKDVAYPRGWLRAHHVLWDEFQDNSPFQSGIFYAMRPHRGVPSVTVAVGDVKQAIYSFKGASTHGFAWMIETAKEQAPENVHTLTCSFRSAQKIVALGNEIVATLPQYKDRVLPSTTIFKDEGRITVAPPLRDPEEESAWVLGELDRLLRERPAHESFMVLHRNNLDEHPIRPALEQLILVHGARIRFLTVHRSKGLEADHVFLLGLTSTIFPDPRGNQTQEINLFYVACTRARSFLNICCPSHKLKVDKQGVEEWVHVGPSPFLGDVPTLDGLSDNAGWPTQAREKGRSSHRQAQGAHLELVSGKISALEFQWKQTWPLIPLRWNAKAEPVHADDEVTHETGASAVPDEIAKLEKRSLYSADGTKTELKHFSADGQLREKVKKKLRDGFFRNGDVPRINGREFATARTSGWIVRDNAAGRYVFATSFLEAECRA